MSRVLNLEWAAGSMNWSVLDHLQEDREAGLHTGLMTTFIQWQAKGRDRIRKLRRDAHVEARKLLRQAGENNRTADIVADLWSAWPVLEDFATETGAAPHAILEALRRRIWDALLVMLGAQATLIADAGPAEQFRAGLTSVLASGRGYLKHAGATPVPEEWKDRCGWRGDEAKGVCLGYLAPNENEVWLVPSATYQEVCRMVPLAVSQRAVWKRLQETGWLILERADRNLARRYLPGGGRDAFVVLNMDALWPKLSDPGRNGNQDRPSETSTTIALGPKGPEIPIPETYTPNISQPGGEPPNSANPSQNPLPLVSGEEYPGEVYP